MVPEDGFGFINSDDREFFFHRTGLNAVEWDELAVGQAVDFSVGAADPGDQPGEHPRAVNVRLARETLPAEGGEPLPREKTR